MQVPHSHHVKHKKSQEDGKSERPEEMNEYISQERAIEQAEITNHTSLNQK
jgi:hypothetical protein